MNAKQTAKLVDGMERMKVGESVDDGKHIIRRTSRSEFRIGEVCGDWITSGSRAVIAARYLSGRKS